MQQNLTDKQLAPVIAAEIQGHVLPGLTGQGAAPYSTDAQHVAAEKPATDEAKKNAGK